MDRPTANLFARVFGALALSAFFVHVGMHLQRDARDTAPFGAWVFVSFLLLLGVAGAWAQARLNAKRAALWTSLGVNGLLPMGAFALHAMSIDARPFSVILFVALAFGLATTVVTGRLLAQPQGAAA